MSWARWVWARLESLWVEERELLELVALAAAVIVLIGVL